MCCVTAAVKLKYMLISVMDRDKSSLSGDLFLAVLTVQTCELGSHDLIIIS